MICCTTFIEVTKHFVVTSDDVINTIDVVPKMINELALITLGVRNVFALCGLIRMDCDWILLVLCLNSILNICIIYEV